jgi:hypothetical protein
MGRKGILRMTRIDIGQTKRNNRSQVVHLKRARALQAVEDEDGSWRNKEGRPSKQAQVEAWQAANPNGTKYACIKETGLSKPTVYKWWKG